MRTNFLPRRNAHFFQTAKRADSSTISHTTLTKGHKGFDTAAFTDHRLACDCHAGMNDGITAN
jgi:hypothetical protein